MRHGVSLTIWRMVPSKVYVRVPPPLQTKPQKSMSSIDVAVSTACRSAASPHSICFRLTCAAYLLIVIGCTLPDVRVAPEADQRDGGTTRGQAATTTTTTTPQAAQQAAGRAAEARASGGSGTEPAVGSMAAGTTAGSAAAVGGAGGVRADAAAGSASDDETLVDAGNISSNENTADAGNVDGAGGTPASTNMPRASQCEVANGGCDVDPMATCHEAEAARWCALARAAPPVQGWA